MKQTKVTEWIISGNPEQYNVVDAFHNLHRVDWAQKANMTAGDIVYIYVSGNVKAIKFKCRVNKADLDESDIDDREYDLSGQFDGTAGRYMELELLEEYVGDEYSREELMKHGFRSPQGPIRMPESVKQYLESISVFEHRYPVNTAVWIATALLSAESFDSNPVCSKKDMYFKQTAIIQRAQKLAESSVANARCSQWCCADNDNSSNNYLRGDSEENSSLRRLSLLDEFPEKTHPEGLNMADELTMNGNKITMEELFYFVREQYPTIIGIEKTESVYESYVAQQMKKVMSPEGWDVSSQDKGHYLFTEPRRQFALRPDIVMKRGERTVILDTKWKSLVDNERVNYGISQADMYQMYAYSKKYNTPEIWLLYPVNDEMRNHYPIRFESGDGITVNLHFVDVDKIEESLQELRSKLEEGE